MTINYTKIDQEEVRDELITLLRSTETFKNANFSGTVLYELANTLSYNASLFGFYLNNIANEPFIDTSKQYKNINRIANSLLYNPIGKGSAKVAVASSLTKEYVLSNTEGFIEIPTYSQFPSTRLTSSGENFAFTNEKPLVVQVQQFGVYTVKDTNIKYVGEVTGTNILDPGQLVIDAQKKKPAQIVESDGSVTVVEQPINSVAHDTLTSFLTNIEYSLTIQNVSGTYTLVIRPKTTTVLSNEIMRFKVNSQRQVEIIQNYSTNKLYLGRLGFRNLEYTSFKVIRQLGNVDSVGRVELTIPRYSPAFEVLSNGEVYSFSSNEQDIIIESDDLEQGQFEVGEDVNIVLNLTDLNAQFFGAKLDLKKNEDVKNTDIVMGIISSSNLSDGNILAADESSFLTGVVKSGKITFFGETTAQRIIFDTPFDFGLPTEQIPINNNKNYSIFIYANDNVRSFYTNKTTEGFVVNVESDTGFEGDIYWRAVEYQRSDVKQELIDIKNLQGLFDTSKEYSVLLQSGLNVLTWVSDVNKNGFKVNSDVSFIGDVDYLILPEGDFDRVGSPKLAGTEYISKGEVEYQVTFDKELENADYQVFLQPENNVNVWFENKTTEGFIIRIEVDTDFFGRVDWQVYQGDLSGTITFGGGDIFIDQISVQYIDLPETSNLGFVTQGLAKISQIEETGLINNGINGLELSYDTDITINPGLSFLIDDSNISYNNIRVFVKTNSSWVEWTQADNFTQTIDSASKIFYVRVNKDQKISIKFGNDDFRGVDPTGSKIVILGLDCVGSQGNIGENVLDTEIIGSLNFQTSDVVTSDVEAEFIDLIKVKRDAFFSGTSTAYLTDYLGNEVSSDVLSAIQIGTGIFGTEPEGIESIRKNAQFAHRSQDRLVTAEDYKTIIKNNFSDFIIDIDVFNYDEANAVGLIPQGEDYRNYFNTLFFMMIPSFGTSFSLFQRDNIKSFLDSKSKRMTGVDIYILEPKFISIDVAISFSHNIGASPIQIRNNISSGVYEYFKRVNRTLGETITTESIRSYINLTDITQLNMMIKRDETKAYTAQDYDVDITPDQFEDAFKDVQEAKLQEVIKKELRNLVGKGLIEIKQPLFDVQYPSGERTWLFTGDVQLSRFEFPILGDLIIERKV